MWDPGSKAAENTVQFPGRVLGENQVGPKTLCVGEEGDKGILPEVLRIYS